MKIVNHKSPKGPKLGSVSSGKVVQFNKSFHQDYPPNELFITIEVVYSYIPENVDSMHKRAVVCLANGKLSWVSRDRTVVVMNAEVNVDGPN